MPPCTWCGDDGEHLDCQAARIVALARSTEEYAETLTDIDLANVYFGRALGLQQAAEMLMATQLAKDLVDTGRYAAAGRGCQLGGPPKAAVSSQPIAEKQGEQADESPGL